MDGPISTSEAAGPAQQAASVPFRSPSVGPPEKVPPVSEGNRSRSSVRDEAGLPGKIHSNPAAPDRKAGARGSAKTQSPPLFVEFRPGEAEDSGRGRQTGASQEASPNPVKGDGKERGQPVPADQGSAGNRSEIKNPFESGADQGRESLPLPGDSSAPAPREALTEALAAAKARWAEVNQEALEANTLPGQPLPDPSSDAAPAEDRDITDTRRTPSTADVGFSSKAPDPTAPTAKDSPDVEMSNGLQRQLTIRYENLATSLSNPHPTRPVIDLFV